LNTLSLLAAAAGWAAQNFGAVQQAAVVLVDTGHLAHFLFLAVRITRSRLGQVVRAVLPEAETQIAEQLQVPILYFQQLLLRVVVEVAQTDPLLLMAGLVAALGLLAPVLATPHQHHQVKEMTGVLRVAELFWVPVAAARVLLVAQQQQPTAAQEAVDCLRQLPE
jgi:hypothetical protein